MDSQCPPDDGFNTQPPEGGWGKSGESASNRAGFNTQPPEGGWLLYTLRGNHCYGFNTQPPEGGWLPYALALYSSLVSTHSRPKAAGQQDYLYYSSWTSFNTQPPEGGWLLFG